MAELDTVIVSYTRCGPAAAHDMVTLDTLNQEHPGWVMEFRTFHQTSPSTPQVRKSCYEHTASVTQTDDVMHASHNNPSVAFGESRPTTVAAEHYL